VVFYRVAQEGVTNALRHAEPTRILVGLVTDPATGELSLTVRDDGRGINGAQPGAGIQGMRERALLLGAQLDIDSDSEGTTVTLRASPR